MSDLTKGPEAEFPREADTECERVLTLAPTFVDGELSEALAGSVRTHLIDCSSCRVAIQEETSLRQWFEPLAGEAGRADLAIPEGFAARVTDLAFSGATAGTGSTAPETLPQMASAAMGSGDHARRGPRLLPSEPSSASEAAQETRSSSVGFLVGLTAAAAALMITFTLMLAQDSHLDVGDMPLAADMPLEEGLRELDALNEALEASSAGPPDAAGANQEEAAPERASGPDDPSITSPNK